MKTITGSFNSSEWFGIWKKTMEINTREDDAGRGIEMKLGIISHFCRVNIQVQAVLLAGNVVQFEEIRLETGGGGPDRFTDTLPTGILNRGLTFQNERSGKTIRIGAEK